MKQYLVLSLFFLAFTSARFVQAQDFAQTGGTSDQGERTKSFTVSKGGTIEVSVGVGDIRLVPWNKNEVYVKATGIDEDEMDRLKMTQSGNTVRVSYRPRGGWSHGNVEFEINVPEEFNTDIGTSGGDIEISGTMNGKIKGSTSGGEIKLKNVGGTVDMSTSGGDVRVGDISGDGELRTSGGDISIGKVNGELDVNTSGGSITVSSVGKSLRARTAGGDIEIGDVGGEANVSTAGGNIEMGKVSGKASMSTAGGDIVLKGASGTVKASTSGGDVRLENISGSITASTAGGEVEAELNPASNSKSKLSSAGGVVKIAVPENAKVTIEATIRYDGWGSWGKKKDRYAVKSDFKADSYEKDDDSGEIRAVYTINGGGARVELSTSSADIEIRKMRAK